jgi:hypothetical protein
MTLREVYDLQNALRTVSKMPGARFAYAVAKNQRQVDACIRKYEKKYRAPHEDEPKYQQARIEVCKTYCDKDEDGHPVLKNGTFQGLIGNTEFEAAMEALKEDYKGLFAFKEEQQDRFDKALDEELPQQEQPKLHMIRFKDIPEDVTADQIGGLLPLILDPPE